MKKRLIVQDFIEQHQDWEKLLSEKPYCITVTRDRVCDKNLIMFKYSQIDSDFNLQLVRECRGLILDEDNLEIVSFPFTKFGNYGESYCPEIDWKTARTGEKVDGSLCKVVVWKDDSLVKSLISTNGTIDAFKAPVAEQIGCPYKSFGNIISECLAKSGVSHADFEEGFTYMFELCSPWTRVVVPHKENKLYFLGKRNNKTFEETYFTDDPVMTKFFDTPKVYPLKSIDECLAATKDMPWNEEGYVVCDAKFNRVKVKSPSYVAAHHLKGNGVMSYSRALELVRANEIEEICQYFEEFRSALEEMKEKWLKLVADAEQAEADLESWKKAGGFDTQPWWIESGGAKRKDLACWIMKNYSKFSGMLFGLVDKKVESAKSFFESTPADKLLKVLGYKE